MKNKKLNSNTTRHRTFFLTVIDDLIEEDSGKKKVKQSLDNYFRDILKKEYGDNKSFLLKKPFSRYPDAECDF